MELYEHQEEGLELFLRERGHGKWVQLVQPTASGKTAVVQVAVYLAVEKRQFRLALIATPFEAIEDAFAMRDAEVAQGGTGEVGDETLAQVTIETKAGRVTIPTSFWNRLRGQDKPASEELALVMAGRGERGAYVTTHTLLAGWGKSTLPKQLDDCLLVIDEAHHLGFGHVDGDKDTQLYTFAAEWLARGGTLWTVTATPFRADRQRISPAEVDTLTFEYSELASRGILPKNIRLRTVGIPTDNRPVNLLLDSDYAHIAKLVQQEGRIALLRVPAGGEGGISVRADGFTTAFQRLGYTAQEILDSTGEENAKEVRARLSEERVLGKAGYAKLTAKVYLSCRRLGEGVDTPSVGHVVFVGVPMSLNAILQTIGRGTRAKHGIPDYPEDWVDEVLVTMVVPRLPLTPEGEVAEKAVRQQVERFLHIACALECNDAILDFHRHWVKVSQRLRLPPVTRAFKGRHVDKMADARLVGVKAASYLRALDEVQAPTLGAVREVIDRWAEAETFDEGGDSAVAALDELVQLTASTNPTLAQGYKEALNTVGDSLAAVRAGQEEGVILPRQVYVDLLRKALDKLVDTHRDLVTAVDLDIGRTLTGVLTPERMRTIAREMGEARDRAYYLTDLEVVEKVILPYKAMYGRLPSLTLGQQDVSSFVGASRSLTQIDQMLRRTGFDLSRLCAVHHWVLLPPPQLSAIRRAWMARKRFPKIAEHEWSTLQGLMQLQAARGPLWRVRVGQVEESVVGLTLAARRGWRGLPGNQTLEELLESPTTLKIVPPLAEHAPV